MKAVPAPEFNELELEEVRCDDQFAYHCHLPVDGAVGAKSRPPPLPAHLPSCEWCANYSDCYDDTEKECGCCYEQKMDLIAIHRFKEKENAWVSMG